MAGVIRSTWGSIGDFVSKRRAPLSPGTSPGGCTYNGSTYPPASSTPIRGTKLKFCSSGTSCGGFSQQSYSNDCDSDELIMTTTLEQRSLLEAYLHGDEIQKGEDNDSGLRKLCWKGVPTKHRAECWKLLTGYLPTSRSRREQDLQRKRQEYHDQISQFFSDASPSNNNTRTSTEFDSQQKVIRKDVPRTAPTLPFFQDPLLQGVLERILTLWSLRHPTPGYVQGMNDVATPFLYVFLCDSIERSYILSDKEGVVAEGIELLKASPEILANAEADAYWCLNRMLDAVQDNYTDHQPGIQNKMAKLDRLMLQVTPRLARHFAQEEIHSLQYAFRYINCLFVREFPLPIVVRLWDTFFSEGDDFPDLQVYVGERGGGREEE